MNDKERFYAKTERDPKTGCLEWTGALDQDGYGVFWIDGKTQRAHRYAFQIAHGSIGESDVLLHLCDNPKCVEPTHLSIGSQSDNLTDMKDKGRAAKGSDNANTKLTENDIPIIRRLANMGFTPTKIATRFEVDAAAIKDVLTGRTWSHIDE